MRVIYYLVNENALPEMLHVAEDPEWVPRTGEFVMLYNFIVMQDLMCVVRRIAHTPHKVTADSAECDLVQIMVQVASSEDIKTFPHTTVGHV